MSRLAILSIVGGCVLFTGTIQAESPLEVTVALSPAVDAGSFSRCICFYVYSDCVFDPVQICEVLTFGPPENPAGVAHAVLDIEDGLYECIEAWDPLHTLRSTGTVTNDEPFPYSHTAVFVDPPGSGGNWLVGGNLNGDGVIDAFDDAVYLSEQGSDYGTGDTTCTHMPPHADVNGDGVVDTLDGAFIVTNSGALNMATCCPDEVDDDHDGAWDRWDNCPGTYNPYQDDHDGDGIGDACSTPIPTTSQWGIGVMTLLLLVAGSLVFSSRRRPASA